VIRKQVPIVARILVIDDDAEIRHLIRRILEKEDHEVLDAPNGKIGVELYEQKVPDVIITDMVMPEMEGAETIVNIRSRCLDAKIIAISGGSDFVGAPTCLRVGEVVGAMRTLSKPFTHAEIREAVREVLDTD
jgi:two-component system, response regulator, stage 0 sporulation protein F